MKRKDNKVLRFLSIFIVVLIGVFHTPIQELSAPIQIVIALFTGLLLIFELGSEMQSAKQYVSDSDSTSIKNYKIICVSDILCILLFLGWIFIPLKNVYSFILLAILAVLEIVIFRAYDNLKTRKTKH